VNADRTAFQGLLHGADISRERPSPIQAIDRLAFANF
jgi:hypothetical protein